MYTKSNFLKFHRKKFPMCNLQNAPAYSTDKHTKKNFILIMWYFFGQYLPSANYNFCNCLTLNWRHCLLTLYVCVYVALI